MNDPGVGTEILPIGGSKNAVDVRLVPVLQFTFMPQITFMPQMAEDILGAAGGAGCPMAAVPA